MSSKETKLDLKSKEQLKLEELQELNKLEENLKNIRSKAEKQKNEKLNKYFTALRMLVPELIKQQDEPSVGLKTIAEAINKHISNSS